MFQNAKVTANRPHALGRDLSSWSGLHIKHHHAREEERTALIQLTLQEAGRGNGDWSTFILSIETHYAEAKQ